MPKVSINNNELYYELQGQGKPLILINGIIADHNAWKFVLPELIKHRQVLIFDNRGAGQSDSPTPGYTIADMADDVLALMDHFKLEKPDILGHSMGGCIVQDIAYRHPEKISSAIISSSFIKLNASFRIFAKTRISLYKLNAPRELFANSIIPWAYGAEYLAKPGVYEAILTAHLNNPYYQTEKGYQGQYEAMISFDSKDWIKKIKVPTQVICGSHDIVALDYENKEIADSISGSKFSVVNKAGHNPEAEQPENFLKILKSFLNF